MAKDYSYLGCKHCPQAYDADVCCDCIYDTECYERFLASMSYFTENKPVNNAFGRLLDILPRLKS